MSRALSTARLLLGGVEWWRSGKTSTRAHQALIDLFCATGGLSNDAVHALVSALRRPRPFEPPHGVLGELDAPELRRVAGVLDREGYYIFPRRLPDDLCDRLTAFALSAPCRARPETGPRPAPGLYPRGAPGAPRYDYEIETTVLSPDVQALLCDRSIGAVAQAYLGCDPVIDLVAMWWHTAFSKVASAESAQLFHFDMDRVKWLKFFIYLTDVDAETGPHTFVAGSHRRGAIPAALLRKGYARLGDEEVEAHFPRERFITFTGPRGTVFAEDTRGLHRGRPVVAGDRLVLQVELADCLFGANYPRVPLRLDAAALRELRAARPRLFSAFSQ